MAAAVRVVADHFDIGRGGDKQPTILLRAHNTLQDDKLGHYEVLSLLGQGGISLGDLWRAVGFLTRLTRIPNKFVPWGTTMYPAMTAQHPNH